MKNLRWLRNQPVEYATYVISYELNHRDDDTKVKLTVHLPSKRVSEKYYDETGVLKKYVHSSPMANEHIEYLCSRDNKLAEIIRKAEFNRIDKSTHYKSPHTDVRCKLLVAGACILFLIGFIYLIFW